MTSSLKKKRKNLENDLENETIDTRERETDTYARMAITTTQPNYYVAFHSVSSTWKKTFENVCRENQRCLCLLFSVAVLCHTTRRHRFSIIFSFFRNANLYPFFLRFCFVWLFRWVDVVGQDPVAAACRTHRPSHHKRIPLFLPDRRIHFLLVNQPIGESCPTQRDFLFSFVFVSSLPPTPHPPQKTKQKEKTRK